MKPNPYKLVLVSMLATICVLLCIIIWAVLTNPHDKTPSQSPPTAHSELAYWDQALRMLSIADEMPPHERGLWILATNFANDGYVFDDGTPIGMNADDILQANCKGELHPPGRRHITWTIAGTPVWSMGQSMLRIEKKNAGYESSFWTEFQQEWLQTTKGLNVLDLGREMITNADMIHQDQEKAEERCRRLLDSHGYTATSEFSSGEGWWSLVLKKSVDGYDYELYVNEVTEDGVTELTAEHTEAQILFSRSDP
jgi:hypothetical protein